MDRDPRDLDRSRPDTAGMDDAAFTAWLEALPPPPGLPSTPEEIAASDERARAQIERGEGIPHAIVGEWLKTWGKPGRLSFWDWYSARNG